jgi:hypothetical protein
MRFVNEADVVTKSQDGKVVMWNIQNGQVKQQINVRGFGLCLSALASSQYQTMTTTFDLTRDLQYIVVGTSKGSVHVYHLASGKLITTLEHRRSRMPVKGCVVSHFVPPLNVVYVSDNFVWRWDYIDPQTRASTQPTIEQSLKLKRRTNSKSTSISTTSTTITSNSPKKTNNNELETRDITYQNKNDKENQNDDNDDEGVDGDGDDDNHNDNERHL